MTVREALDALEVAEEDTTEYRRSYFRHWIDSDRDGCNTRQELLLEEAVEAPEQDAGCKLTGGRWYSAYDDTYIDGPSGLDADHRVPLDEAWDSGAPEWTAQERQDFANEPVQCGHRMGDEAGSRNARGSRAVEGGVLRLNSSAREPRWFHILSHSTCRTLWSSG